MKKFLFKPYTLLAFFVLSLSLSSCLKEADRDYQNSASISAAGVAFAHTSPKTGMLDFVDGDVYRGNILSRLNYNTYAAFPLDNQNTTPYRAFMPGQRIFGVALTGTNVFLNLKQFSLTPNKLYTLFAIDTASKTTLFMVQDSTRSMDSTKAMVKFINLCPDSKKINFFVNNNATPAAADKAYTESSAYMVFEPGDAYTITVAESATPAMNAKRENVALKKGGIYTIWARGLEASSDSTKLNVSVLKTQ